MNRKDVLLRAAYDLLRRADNSFYVKNAMEILTKYDGTNCDGHCLMTDIANELGIDEDAEPIPLDDEE